MIKPTVFITGGAGLLGLNWALAIQCDHRVILGLHYRRITLEETESCLVNLDSLDHLLALIESIQPELIVHTAGLTNVERCEKSPELAIHVNTKLAANVAMAANIHGVRHIHISTDHLFSGDKPLVKEDEPIAPVNMYALSKGKAEAEVLNCSPNSLIIRTNFYGWGPPYRQSFSDRIIKALRLGSPITLFEDVFFTPIIIDELIKVAHNLIEHNASGIYHVVGDTKVSKLEFGLKIAKHFNLNSDLIKIGRLSEQKQLTERPLNMSLSNEKTRNFLKRPLGSVDQHISRLKNQEGSPTFQKISQI